MGHQMYFKIPFFVLDFIFMMDCVFIVKVFYHMLVTSDKISGRRSLWQLQIFWRRTDITWNMLNNISGRDTSI